MKSMIAIQQPNNNTMGFCFTTFILLSGVASMATVVASMQVEGRDTFCIVGAVLASVVVVLGMQGRTRREIVSCLLSSSFVGAILPGLVVHFLWPEQFSKLTWHAWAGLGFIGGGLGWGLTKAVFSMGNKKVKEIEQKFLDKDK